MLRIIAVLFWLAVIFLAVAFSVPNLQPVPLHYYAGTLEVPLAVLVLLSVWGGALLGIVFTYGQIVKLRYENRRLRKLGQAETAEPAA